MSTIKGTLSNEPFNRTLTKIRGRKAYRCYVCTGEIEKGEKHYKFGTFPGVGRVHVSCVNNPHQYKIIMVCQLGRDRSTCPKIAKSDFYECDYCLSFVERKVMVTHQEEGND